MFKLVSSGHPVLKMNCQKIENFDPKLSEITDEMFSILKGKGIGLAAPQIGLPWQLFVVNINNPIVFINPTLSYDTRRTVANEGCLSLPGIQANVERAINVSIEAFDLNGKPFKAKYAGLYSRCVQHEFDHLKGKLIVDLNTIKLNPVSDEELKEWETMLIEYDRLIKKQ